MSTEPSILIPLVSPFTDDGSSLSEVRISRLVRRWTQLGSHAFFLGGDAGEFLCLSSGERKTLVEVVLRDSCGSATVVVNISSLSTSKSLDLSQHAARHGARAGFLTPPYFGKYSDAELLNHIRTVVNFSNLPIVLGDPLNQISPALHDQLRDIPRVKLATVRSWDQWSSSDFIVSAHDALAAILEQEPTHAMQALLDLHGPAAVMKAAYERSGLDLGYPRSPRASLAGSELPRLLAQAA